MPSGLEAAVVYNGTVFIERSIEELLISLAQALAIVTVVIYLFLGSVRAALVPAVAMPLALVGALFLMLLMGFSINLLTLLALILAIGTVVDGDTLNVNYHMRVRAQWYAVDFAKVGGPSGRVLSNEPKPDEIEDFYSWGTPVLSPGTVR